MPVNRGRSMLTDYVPASSSATALSTRSARSVTHLFGCFVAPKSPQVFPL